jgi:hypothetical protein
MENVENKKKNVLRRPPSWKFLREEKQQKLRGSLVERRTAHNRMRYDCVGVRKKKENKNHLIHRVMMRI